MTNSYSNSTLTPLFAITLLLSFTLASCNGEKQILGLNIDGTPNSVIFKPAIAGSYLYKLDNIKLDFSYASLNFEIGNTQPLSKLVYYKLALSSSANIGLGTFGNSESRSLNTLEGYLLHTAKLSLTFNNIFVLKMGLGLVIH